MLSYSILEDYIYLYSFFNSKCTFLVHIAISNLFLFHKMGFLNVRIDILKLSDSWWLPIMSQLVLGRGCLNCHLLVNSGTLKLDTPWQVFPNTFPKIDLSLTFPKRSLAVVLLCIYHPKIGESWISNMKNAFFSSPY